MPVTGVLLQRNAGSAAPLLKSLYAVPAGPYHPLFHAAKRRVGSAAAGARLRLRAPLPQHAVFCKALRFICWYVYNILPLLLLLPTTYRCPSCTPVAGIYRMVPALSSKLILPPLALQPFTILHFPGTYSNMWLYKLSALTGCWTQTLCQPLPPVIPYLHFPAARRHMLYPGCPRWFVPPFCCSFLALYHKSNKSFLP